MFFKLIKWTASCFRLLRWKLRFGSRLVLPGSGKIVYIGKGCTLRIAPNGRIVLGAGVVLSDYVTLEASAGAVLQIGNDTFLNTFCRIYAMESVTIGESCMLGSNVSVYDHDHDISRGVHLAGKAYKIAPVSIGNYVWCGTNVVVTRGSQICENNVVGANAVVSGCLEANGVNVGLPAKRKREIEA